MSDAFDGAQEIAPSQVSFGKKGDYIIGYFTGSKDITTNNGDTKLYELKGIQGEFHVSSSTNDENGNKIVTIAKEPTVIAAGDYYSVWGGKSAVDDLFKKVKIGQKVGVRFEDAIPSKKKGNSPFKVMKTVMWDEIMETPNPMDNVVDSSTVPGVDF